MPNKCMCRDCTGSSIADVEVTSSQSNLLFTGIICNKHEMKLMDGDLINFAIGISNWVEVDTYGEVITFPSSKLYRIEISANITQLHDRSFICIDLEDDSSTERLTLLSCSSIGRHASKTCIQIKSGARLSLVQCGDSEVVYSPGGVKILVFADQ